MAMNRVFERVAATIVIMILLFLFGMVAVSLWMAIHWWVLGVVMVGVILFAIMTKFDFP